MVQDYSDRVEKQYAAGCDLLDSAQSVVWKYSRMFVLRAWLTLQHPLQKRSMSQPQYSRVQGLRTAIAIIQLNEQIDESPDAARFTWFTRIYAPWHTLVVALAELCRETSGELVETAWPIFEKAFTKWTEWIAATKEAEMWRLITSLLKRARAARQRASQNPGSSEPTGLASLLNDVGLTNINQSKTTSRLRSQDYLDRRSRPQAFQPRKHTLHNIFLGLLQGAAKFKHWYSSVLRTWQLRPE